MLAYDREWLYRLVYIYLMCMCAWVYGRMCMCVCMKSLQANKQTLCRYAYCVPSYPCFHVRMWYNIWFVDMCWC